MNQYRQIRYDSILFTVTFLLDAILIFIDQLKE